MPRFNFLCGRFKNPPENRRGKPGQRDLRLIGINVAPQVAYCYA